MDGEASITCARLWTSPGRAFCAGLWPPCRLLPRHTLALALGMDKHLVEHTLFRVFQKRGKAVFTFSSSPATPGSPHPQYLQECIAISGCLLTEHLLCAGHDLGHWIGPRWRAYEWQRQSSAPGLQRPHPTLSPEPQALETSVIKLAFVRTTQASTAHFLALILQCGLFSSPGLLPHSCLSQFLCLPWQNKPPRYQEGEIQVRSHQSL